MKGNGIRGKGEGNDMESRGKRGQGNVMKEKKEEMTWNQGEKEGKEM